MPTPTYTPLANLTLSSSAASVTFSSISQAYRDLVLVMDIKTTVEANVGIRFNSDTSGNTKYNRVRMRGNGSTATSDSSSGDEIFYIGATPNSTVAAQAILNIQDYSATDKHKTILMRSGRADQDLWGAAIRWADTSAMTAIVISAGNLASGSTFALYGIAA